MSMFKIFDISGSAVSSQSQRLNTVASNLANVDTVAGPDGKPYKAREVTFQTVLMNTPDGVPGALHHHRRRGDRQSEREAPRHLRDR